MIRYCTVTIIGVLAGIGITYAVWEAQAAWDYWKEHHV